MFGLFKSRVVKKSFESTLRAVLSRPRYLQMPIAMQVIDELRAFQNCTTRESIQVLSRGAKDRRHAAVRSGATDEGDSRYAPHALLESLYLAALVEQESLPHIQGTLIRWASDLGFTLNPSRTNQSTASSSETAYAQAVEKYAAIFDSTLSLLQTHGELAQVEAGKHINFANSALLAKFGNAAQFKSSSEEAQLKFLKSLASVSEKLGAKSLGGLAYLLFATWLSVLCTGNQQYGRIYEDKLAVLSKSVLGA